MEKWNMEKRNEMLKWIMEKRNCKCRETKCNTERRQMEVYDQNPSTAEAMIAQTSWEQK